MGKRVCPWWWGYLLASPIRRLMHDPAKTLAPYIREGMTVLEPGPGMGFFTLELARRVGASGRVIALEVQPKMLEGLKPRAARCINPYHTNGDGDSTFALSTNKLKIDMNISVAGALAAEAVSEAVVRAAQAATSIPDWPAYRDFTVKL